MKKNYPLTKFLLFIISLYAILLTANTNDLGFVPNTNMGSSSYNVAISFIYVLCLYVIYKILNKEGLEGIYTILRSKAVRLFLVILVLIALAVIFLFAYQYRIMLKTYGPFKTSFHLDF